MKQPPGLLTPRLTPTMRVPFTTTGALLSARPPELPATTF